MSNVIQFQPLHPENPVEEIRGRTYRRALTGKAAQQSYAAQVKNHLARPEQYPAPDAQDARGARRQARQAAKVERKKHRRGFVRRELRRERVASDLKFFFSIWNDESLVDTDIYVRVAATMQSLIRRAIAVDLEERAKQVERQGGDPTELEPISEAEATIRLYTIAQGGVVPSPKEKRYNEGGILQPSLTLVENRTGLPEPIITTGRTGRAG